MIDGLYKTMGLPHMQFHQSMESGQGKKLMKNLYFKIRKLSDPLKQTIKEIVQYCRLI